MSLTRSFTNFALSAAALLAACGQPEPMAANGPIPGDARDVRVAVPAADPAYIDFVGPELVIGPGEDKMFCQHIEYEGEDAAFANIDFLQGKFGHHFILLGAKEAKETGTLEDCSDAADMAKYDAYTAGGEGIPAAHGIFLPKGKRMVMQSHYVNASTRPLLVRDVLRLKRRPVSEVKTWVALWATSHMNFSIEPGQVKKVTYECTMPVDVKMTLFGGHMHEWGTRFTAEIGSSPASMTKLYDVEKWTAEYRDSPPIKLMESDPMAVAKGSLLRVTCEFNNTEGKVLSFPHEMCATFAYVAGSREAIDCRYEDKK